VLLHPGCAGPPGPAGLDLGCKEGDLVGAGRSCREGPGELPLRGGTAATAAAQTGTLGWAQAATGVSTGPDPRPARDPASSAQLPTQIPVTAAVPGRSPPSP